MQILPPDDALETLWQGALLSPAPLREPQQVKAGIAVPQQWSMIDLIPTQWTRPVSGRHLYLLRFVFWLETNDGHAPIAAEFSALLKQENDRSGLFFDAFPREQPSHMAPPARLRVVQGFKLMPGDPVQPGAETIIDYGKVPPIIHSEGVGSAHVTWQFQVHPHQPVLGRRVLLAVVSLPPEMPAVTVQFDFSVTLRDSLGQFTYLSLPERLAWRAGEDAPPAA